MLKIKQMKICSCGMCYFSIPLTAKFIEDGDLSGWYFDCGCKSTLFVSQKQQ